MSKSKSAGSYKLLDNGIPPPDDLSKLTPEEQANRWKKIQFALLDYQFELYQAELAANPGLEKTQ